MLKLFDKEHIMNPITLTSRISILAVLMLMSAGMSFMAEAADNGCWADFYEFPNFKGAHVLIKGPIQLPNLKNYEGQNWESRFDSAIIGPKAKVKVYENIDYKLTLGEIAKYPDLMNALGISQKDLDLATDFEFTPGNKTHHLGEFNFHKKIKSLKIDCL
ncbi:MAG: beta/gamma crystallin domain-containing protein [Gammaproteobacteria bacterium]